MARKAEDDFIGCWKINMEAESRSGENFMEKWFESLQNPFDLFTSPSPLWVSPFSDEQLLMCTQISMDLFKTIEPISSMVFLFTYRLIGWTSPSFTNHHWLIWKLKTIMNERKNIFFKMPKEFSLDESEFPFGRHVLPRKRAKIILDGFNFNYEHNPCRLPMCCIQGRLQFPPRKPQIQIHLSKMYHTVFRNRWLGVYKFIKIHTHCITKH